MTRRLLAFAGLGQPRRFERTLALGVAAVLGLVVAASAIHFHLSGKLPDGSPRYWYFVYMGGLVVLAVLLLPWPRVSAGVLSLLALEVAFGIGTALLYKFGAVDQTLFPREIAAEDRFRWHPLLQAVPIPSRDGVDDPETHHNVLGQRGRERPLRSLQGKTTIALFGGSTTYDVGSPEGEAWGDRLEAMLGADRFAVINHGVPGYATAEHVVQTAFYESSQGVRPRCSIYYIGWNDLRNSHVPGLDPGYADFHLRAQIDNLQVRRLRNASTSISPTLMFVTFLAILAADTARPVAGPGGFESSEPDPVFEATYLRNVRTISAVNRQRGITTVWVGQVMDHRRLQDGALWRWVPLLRSPDVSRLIVRLNSLLEREASALGDVYVGVAAADFTSDDFFDYGHFLPSGSLKFAERLAPAVARVCGRGG